MRLYGKNPIIERLRSNPASVQKIYVQEGTADLLSIKKKAKQFNIPLIVIHRTKMMKLSKNSNSQGVVGIIAGFEYTDYEVVLERAQTKKRNLLFLDETTDPQNLGAIIRSAACLGRFSIVLPSHKSVSVTESVLRVASGGENYVPIAVVSNINKAIRRAKSLGIWIVGAVVDGGTNLLEMDFPSPVGLVVGSEQKGIRDVVRKNLDAEITIPMMSDTLSFNLAQATTIICYEITRQKNKAGRKTSGSS